MVALVVAGPLRGALLLLMVAAVVAAWLLDLAVQVALATALH